MGNHENKAADRGQGVYCMKQSEVRVMSEIWKSVEADLVHYGNQFYTLLLRNHPQYLKYFQENEPHEFQVDAPTMQTKFSLTCSTLAALFVEYSHKSRPRENLLGYVAMVHKDMNLTQKDMENFMMDMMDLLMQHFPELMTADCCVAYVRYTASLTSRLDILMRMQREVAGANSGSNRITKEPMVGCFRSPYCAWLPCRDQGLIYGRSAEYWEKKRRHWIVQCAVWASTYEEKQAYSSRRGIIQKSNSVKILQTSISKDSTCSDLIYDETCSKQAIRRQFIRRKRQFRKRSNSSSVSNDDITDADEEVISKSNDYRLEEANRERCQRVAIVSSTARERRRLREDDSTEAYPRPATRRSTTKKKVESGKNKDDSTSSDEIGERYIRLNLLKSRNVPNKMRDRGTSISNIPNQSNVQSEYEPMERPDAYERHRTPPSAKNDPPNSIIGSGTAAGRNAKANKRVSISSAHWLESTQFDK